MIKFDLIIFLSQLENGIHMFLWLGLGLNSQWVQGVFGVPSVVQIDTDRTKIPVLDTPLNKRVNEIINCVRADRHHCMRVRIQFSFNSLIFYSKARI